jgi:hypothetical protein
MPDYLFSGNDLFSYLQVELQRARGTVDSIPENQFTHSPDEEIFQHVFSQLHKEPVEIREDLMERESEEVEVYVNASIYRDYSGHVPGLRITIIVPYIGNPYLLQCKPISRTSMPPRAQLSSSRHDAFDGSLKLVFERPSDSLGDGQEIKQSINREIENIKKYLGFVRNDLEQYDLKLEGTIRQAIEQRRERLEKHGEVFEALDIPLKRDVSAPDISKLPIKKKMVRPLPSPPKGDPEPGIREEEYEYILKVIRHEGKTFETAPETFAKFDEEGLRDVMLGHLNGHYEGQATGETFRKKGKTDIRIEDENRAAFVAECKVWGGDKVIQDAVDQLLGYLVWRDCKTALIIFNKTVSGFSKIQERLPEILKAHPNCISESKTSELGEWHFNFRAEDDEDRRIKLHIYLFNLYVNK